jgi:uncharacterized membrane protein YhhN
MAGITIRSYLSLVIAASATLTILLPMWRGDLSWLGYVFMPLTMVLILMLAIASPALPPLRYRMSIIIGLICSLAGDICLMLPWDYFLQGLICFLLAQCMYLSAFTSDSRLALKPAPFFVLGVIGVSIIVTVWNGISVSLRLPVLLYAGMLLTMASQAGSRALHLKTPMAYAAALGAILFVVSDSLLALRKFGYSISCSRLLVLGPYFVAQWLISISTWKQSKY